MKPILSVVIPTRNRQKYCITAIEDILSYNEDGLELCIQDNSNNDEIAQHISKRKVDTRLKYRYIPEQLNSVINMDQAIGMASGKYVCMIGDDDTILPSIFQIVHWADNNNIDSVCSTSTVQYFWPGAYKKDVEGGLLTVIKSSSSTNRLTIIEKLTSLFEHGITRYLTYNLPKVYHGIILRDKLDEIKNIAGHYFGGLSPDIYSTIALCKFIKNHKIISQPITIAGACSDSATSQNVNKGHRGKLKDAPHLTLRGEYHWDKHIPKYYSVETIWAESALKALLELNMDGLIERFNYPYLVAYAALNNKNIFKLAMKESLSKENYYGQKDKFIKIKIGLAFFKVLFDTFLRKFKKDTHICKSIQNVNDISTAAKMVNKS